MLYCFIGRDAPDSAAKRQALVREHLAHIESIMDRIRVAGPVRDGKSAPSVASILVLDAADADEARRLFESDPYFTAGVWQSVEMLPFDAVAGTWIGGKTW